MLSALRVPSAWCRSKRSSSANGGRKLVFTVSAFARPSSSSASADDYYAQTPTRRLRQRTSSDATATATATATTATATAPAPGFMLGDRHSHNAPAGDAAAHAPLAVFGNFEVVGPCHALKLADGSLLVTLPARGGGHVQLARTAGGSGGGAAGPAPAMRLGAAALAAQGPGARPAPSAGEGRDGSADAGRLVLHGELMQLSGSYRVVHRSNSGGDSDGSSGDDSGSSGSRRGAVRRHCGGPALHSGWLDVLMVSALPVGAALVLEAGASLSHPLNATPPPSSPCSDAED